MIRRVASFVYRFGRFELQPDERRLLDRGTTLHLRPHAFDLLLALVEHSGHLVTKDELLERVWGKVIVEENSLQALVSTLRKLLGANAIATVSRRGYRFALEVIRFEIAAIAPSVAPKHNLPHDLTSFIGREKELGEIAGFLGTARLVTLTGSGGCGKTRLAIHLARMQAASYPDGAWFVELAALTDAAPLPQTVASVVGVKERPGAALTDTIAEHLASRTLLLILDNAEHLLEACAQLTESLLRRCAGLVVLVTSRERLAITGELLYRVPSLSVPDEGDVTPESIAAYDSVQLFIDRARLQQPHFELTAQNSSAIASICRRLDGIALALELAAPRVRTNSVEELSRGLDRRFELLTEGSRTAVPRHRTLSALIDWSYGLLNDAEKAMLRQVSVFAGGWTLEAAEQVCAHDNLERSSVLGLLTSLGDKNLVLAAEHEGSTRYGLLETVRQYAQDRLRESGVEAKARFRHLAYLVALAEAAEREPAAGDQREAIHRLEPERDNVRAAISRALTADGDVTLALRLASAITWFWVLRGYFAEGRAWFTALLAAAPKDIDKAARAKALRGASRLAFVQNDYAAAAALRLEGLALWRELGDRAAIAQSLNGLGTTQQARGDYESARALFNEALTIRRALGDRTGILSSLLMSGHSAVERGDFTAARAFLEESLAMSRGLGDWHTSEALYHLGTAAYFQGDLSAARSRLEESLAIRRELQQPHGIAGSLLALGILAHDEGDDRTAQRLLTEALTIERGLGDRRTVTEALEAIGGVALAVAGSRPAARIWGGAEQLRHEISAPMPPAQHPWYSRHVSAARAALADDGAFERAWKEGRMMTYERLVRYALDFAEGPRESAGDER